MSNFLNQRQALALPKRSLFKKFQSLLNIGLSLAFILVATAHAAPPVQPAPKSQVQVQGLGASSVALQNGAFTSQIDIKVPTFHGVEPQLALSYSSSGSNGFVGTGWQLTGLPTIESNYHQGNWRYTLDGEPLVSDTAMGGNYATLRQKFLRISGGSSFQVTQRDGTKMSFNYISGNTWRLSQVEDIHLNKATYNWSCDLGLECYIQSITYANASITFYRELRSDEIGYGINQSPLKKMRYRLKSIDVKLGGARVRTYQLTYANSVRTSRSLLTKVQQFGRDAVLTVNGVVQSGTALPATDFTWSDVASGFDPETDITSSTGLSSTLWTDPNKASQTVMGDFNGDGRQDMLVRVIQGIFTVDIYQILANSTGGFSPAVKINSQLGLTASNLNYALFHPGDFNADGVQDLIIRYPFAEVQQGNAKYYAKYYVGKKTGGFESAIDLTNMQGVGPYGWGISRVEVGDFNGDGYSDLLFPDLFDPNASGSTPPIRYASLSTSSASGFSYANIIQNNELRLDEWHNATFNLADFDGDGRTDILVQAAPYIYGSNNQYYPSRAVLIRSNTDLPLSYGADITSTSGLPGLPAANSFVWACSGVFPGDFNGDGKVDILLKRNVNCGDYATTSYLLYSNGFSTSNPFDAVAFDPVATFNSYASLWNDSEVFTGDINGDGLTDILSKKLGTSTTIPVFLVRSSGANFLPAQNITTANGMVAADWNFLSGIADYDGDGDDDIFLHSGGSLGRITPRILKATSPLSNVITKITNGYGSATTVTYKPSSFWENSGSPPRTQTVTSVITTDGRGNSAATNYEYAGAAWDPVERRHLGFRYVKIIDPSGAYVENIYYQRASYSLGELKESKTFNSSGGLMSRIYRTVSESGAAPWVTLLAQEEVSECNGTGTCKTQQKNYTYDAYGNVTNVIEHGDISVAGDERNTTYVYYPNTAIFIVGLPAEEIMRAGTTTGGQILRHKRNYYDGGSLTAAPTKGDVTRSEQWLNTTNSFIGSTATYDSFGNKLTETDPLGATTTTTWESIYGRYPLSVSNALGHVSALTIDPVCEQKATTTDPNLAITTYTYDNFCRVTREARADGGHTDTAYVNFGTPDQYISNTLYDVPGTAGNSQWTVSSLDGLGREWQSFNNAEETVETTYNSRGLVEKVSAPFGTSETKKFTIYAYDALQRVTRKTFADGAYQQYLYDAWTVTTCDELGKPRTRYSDAYGQIRKVREYKNKTCVMAPTGTLGTDMFDTTINYDLVGQQTGFTNAKGYVSSSVYDSLGRRTSRIDPDMGTWTYAYDDKGRLISQTDAKAQTILLSYDVLDRLVQKSTPAGQSLAYYAYDLDTNGIGRRSRMCVNYCGSGIGVGKAFQYDVMGRLIDERGHNNKLYVANPTVARTYDGAGRVTSLTYPSQEVVTYTYDSAGRLNSMVSDAFASNNIVTSATYNARGNLATRTLGNGVVETFTYDPNRFWLTGVSASLNGTLIHSVSLQRNLRGEVTSRTNTLETNDNWTYIYDDLRRMTSADNANNNLWDESFTFDETNRITFSSRLGTYSYGAIGSGKPAYAPQNINGATMSYDANGNMSSDGVTTLVFDIENRPISVGGIASTYNPDGERTSVGTVSFTHDLSEYDSATGITTNYYLFGESRVASSASQQLTFYHGDHLNSASTMTNISGGVIGRQVLSPFGRKLSTGGYTGPIGLAGQRLDITGLYHMGAREMNPSLGIFVTADPSGAPNPEKPQTLSRYAYANNSPTNLVDPTGYVAEEPSVVINRYVNKGKEIAQAKARDFAMFVAGTAWKAAKTKAEEFKNKAVSYYNTADFTYAPGFTVLAGVPLKGNKVSGLGPEGTLELKAIVNPKRGQIGIQFSYGVGGGTGGGLALLQGADFGLTQGPLKTGWSQSDSAFVQVKAVVEGVPVDVGASVTQEQGGNSVSANLRGGVCCGTFIGGGILHKESYTYVNEPLWGPDYPEKKK